MKKQTKKRVGIILWIALAILCFLYAIVVKSAGSGTSFFCIWFVIGAGCLAVAGFIWKDCWKRMTKPWKIIVSGILTLGILCFVVGEGFILNGFHAARQEQLDYIIVLGTQVYKDGPSPVLKYRLDEAIRYLNNNPDTMCIVSGGQGKNEPFAEAIGMAQYLEQKGIAPDRICMESESKTTVENLTFCKELLPENASIGIVTNNFHMFRAKLIAKKLGVEPVYSIPAASSILFLPNNLLREFFALIKFLVF